MIPAVCPFAHRISSAGIHKDFQHYADTYYHIGTIPHKSVFQHQAELLPVDRKVEFLDLVSLLYPGTMIATSAIFSSFPPVFPVSPITFIPFAFAVCGIHHIFRVSGVLIRVSPAFP